MKYSIGIDIGKFEFVMAIYGQHTTKTYTNDANGISLFLNEYKTILQEALTVVETTGGFEIEVVKAVLNEGYAIHRAPGRQIKNFIRSLGKYTKTDAIDALALARYAKERGDSLDRYVLPSESRHLLNQYVARQMDLKHMLVQEKNRKKAPLNRCHKEIQASIDRHITSIEAELKTLTGLITELKKKDSHIADMLNILESVDGVGPVTSEMTPKNWTGKK